MPSFENLMPILAVVAAVIFIGGAVIWIISRKKQGFREVVQTAVVLAIIISGIMFFRSLHLSLWQTALLLAAIAKWLLVAALVVGCVLVCMCIALYPMWGEMMNSDEEPAPKKRWSANEILHYGIFVIFALFSKDEEEARPPSAMADKTSAGIISFSLFARALGLS